MQLKLIASDTDKNLQKIITLNTEAKSSENKLRSFFDSSSAVHLLIDTDLRLIDFNRAALNFIKRYCNINLMAGLKVTEFLHKEHLTGFIRNYNKVLSGTPMRSERQLKYDEEIITWFITYDPAWDCEGNILGMSLNAIDITEKIAKENKIISQFYALKEIAYIQSHDLRKPVSSIIGLMNIFKADGYIATKEGLQMLENAVDELEVKIKLIESHTS